MNFNQNKDDPHGVQRLLDILTRQQDSSSSSTSSSSGVPSAPAPTSAAYPPPNPFANSSSSSSFDPYGAPALEINTPTDRNIDATRRRTYNTSSKYNLTAPTEEPSFDPYSFNPFSIATPVLSAPPVSPLKPTPASASAAKPTTTRDLGSLSFAQSLPILSTLATDKTLLKRLRSLRSEQHSLEKRLVKEYSEFKATADRQYPNPKLRREQDEKRKKEMLRMWDEGVKRQQGELVRAGVPGIKVDNGDKRNAEKQRKILQVLTDMLDEDEATT